MGKYAENTTVATEKTRYEIESTLRKYGATGFCYASMETTAIIMFEMNGKRIRFALQLPSQSSDQFIYTPSRGYMRTVESALAAWEQACRQKWRALLLIIKAKLEAISSGITIFEEEFMAHIVLPNGQSAGEYVLPKIEAAYHDGIMPPLIALN